MLPYKTTPKIIHLHPNLKVKCYKQAYTKEYNSQMHTRTPPPLGIKQPLSSIRSQARPTPSGNSVKDVELRAGTDYPKINGKIVLPPPEDWSLVPLAFFSTDHAEEIRHRAPGLTMDEVLGRYGISYADLSLPEFVHDEWFFRVNYNIGVSTAKSDMVHALFNQAKAKNGHQSAIEYLVRFADN